MVNNVAITIQVNGTDQAEKQVYKLSGTIGQVGERAKGAANDSAILATALGKVAHYGLAGGGIYALASTIGDVAGALFNASAAVQRLSGQLNFATGGGGAREMEWVSTLANKLGLELNTTANAYPLERAWDSRPGRAGAKEPRQHGWTGSSRHHLRPVVCQTVSRAPGSDRRADAGQAVPRRQGEV